MSRGDLDSADATSVRSEAQKQSAISSGRLMSLLGRRMGRVHPIEAGFYGRPGPGQDGAPGPTQRAGEMQAPIVGLMGGADQAIPPEDVEAFERALTEAGVEHELVTYPDAPHSFFDRKQEEFAEASDDAWRRVLEFLERHGS